jgi:hypothetical protein
MSADINSVTVCFGNGVKREEYGPVKKAEVTLTASVPEGEDGAVVLAHVSYLAMARVAEMLSAPRPDTSEKPIALGMTADQLNAACKDMEDKRLGEQPPARKPRGPNKPKEPEATEPVETRPELILTEDTAVPEVQPEVQPAIEDEWTVGADDIVVSDQELLSALSKRAGDLGGREQCIKLVVSFATRTEGPPFKAQEIPQVQRKDFLTKLAALTA